MTYLDAASYYDTAFETAKGALRDGNLSEFKRLTKLHKEYAKLYKHLLKGGSIH